MKLKIILLFFVSGLLAENKHLVIFEVEAFKWAQFDAEEPLKSNLVPNETYDI